MQIKGSITVFFTLMLSIVISLIGTLLLSARVAVGRVQIATAADLAMFSAMAKYDRALFEEYGLFYIDGGYGTGTLQLGRALDEMEVDMSYLLTPNKERRIMGGSNLLNLERISGSIIGYTLATDCDGSVFYEQVVSYMEETLGLRGISLLSQKLWNDSNLIQSQMESIKSIENQGDIEDYENIKRNAGNKSKENDSLNGEWNQPDDLQQQISKEKQEMAHSAETVIEAVSVAKEGTLFKLVLPRGQNISGWAANLEKLYRNRTHSSGMGYLELIRNSDRQIDNLLFQEYIVQHLNYYGNQRHTTGPVYGVEWVLFEKTSDLENLEASMERLLLIREAANAVSLRADSQRYGQIQTMAEALAAILKAPGIQYILEGIIVLAWAFAESVVDARALFEGKEVPLIKTHNSWQVEFIDILPAIQEPSSYYEENGGLSYVDYLRTLLFLKLKDDKINGCMEVIESSIRELPGREGFSMDCAIDALEAEFQIRSERLITFTITEKRSYRTI